MDEATLESKDVEQHHHHEHHQHQDGENLDHSHFLHQDHLDENVIDYLVCLLSELQHPGNHVFCQAEIPTNTDNLSIKLSIQNQPELLFFGFSFGSIVVDKPLPLEAKISLYPSFLLAIDYRGPPFFFC